MKTSGNPAIFIRPVCSKDFRKLSDRTAAGQQEGHRANRQHHAERHDEGLQSAACDAEAIQGANDAPVARHASSPSRGESVKCIVKAPQTDARPMVAPIERSMPPINKTKVSPVTRNQDDRKLSHDVL